MNAGALTRDDGRGTLRVVVHYRGIEKTALSFPYAGRGDWSRASKLADEAKHTADATLRALNEARTIAEQRDALERHTLTLSEFGPALEGER